MSLLRHLRRLQFIGYLIQHRATGNLQTFANKNRISRSHLMNVLREMKEMGFSIKYSRTSGTYYYDGNKKDSVASTFTSLQKLNLNLQELSNTQIPAREQLSNIWIEQGRNLCFSENHVFEKC